MWTKVGHVCCKAPAPSRLDASVLGRIPNNVPRRGELGWLKRNLTSLLPHQIPTTIYYILYIKCTVVQKQYSLKNKIITSVNSIIFNYMKKLFYDEVRNSCPVQKSFPLINWYQYCLVQLRISLMTTTI